MATISVSSPDPTLPAGQKLVLPASQMQNMHWICTRIAKAADNSRVWTNKTLQSMEQHHLTGVRMTVPVTYRHWKSGQNISNLCQRFRIALLAEMADLEWLDVEADREIVADAITNQIQSIIDDNWVLGMATPVAVCASTDPDVDGTRLIYGVSGVLRYNCQYPFFPLLRSLWPRLYELTLNIDIIGFRFHDESATIATSSRQRPFILDMSGY